MINLTHKIKFIIFLKNFFRFVLRDFKNYPKNSIVRSFNFIDKIVYYDETVAAAEGYREITKDQELIFFRIYQYETSTLL